MRLDFETRLALKQAISDRLRDNLTGECLNCAGKLTGSQTKYCCELCRKKVWRRDTPKGRAWSRRNNVARLGRRKRALERQRVAA